MERVTMVYPYPTYTRSMPSPTGWGIPYLPLPARRLINLRDRAEIEGPDTTRRRDGGWGALSAVGEAGVATGSVDSISNEGAKWRESLFCDEGANKVINDDCESFGASRRSTRRPRWLPPSLASLARWPGAPTAPIPTYPASMVLQEPPGIPSYPPVGWFHPYPTPLDRRIQSDSKYGCLRRKFPSRALVCVWQPKYNER